MSSRINQIAAGLLATGSLAVGQSPQSMPVAPIPPTTWRGMTNVFHLHNERLEIVVAPDFGRIAHVGSALGESMLRLDANASGDFANFGGDWLWPVAQARWPAFNDGRNWPPPALLEKRPWLGNAWKNDDESQQCLMRNTYGPPLNIIVSRKITLEKDARRISVAQRIERTGESTVPVTLWNISQVQNATRAVLPVEDSYKVLGFAPPDAVITRCDSSVVFDAKSGTEHKLGSTSPRAWIAAQRDGLVILEQAMSSDIGEEFPDGGCRVEMYSNTGLGYTEIETLSAEKLLKPGEALENVLTIDLLSVSPDSAACALADLIRAKFEPSP